MSPPVRIEVAACDAWPGQPGRWRVSFHIVNVARWRVVLRDAWLPHGRFRGQGHVPLDVSIAPNETYLLTLEASAREEPGTIVDNAFLILRTSKSRVFARMRVEFDAGGAARPVVEVVTSQSLE